MTDSRQRQPAGDEAAHAIPSNAAVLAPPRQRAMPKPADSESKNRQRRLVHGHAIVANVSTHHRLQPLALVGDGFVHSSPKFGFHLIQLCLQPFTYRLPQHRKPSIAFLLHADVRKAEKVERLRFPFSTPLPLVDRIRTELKQSRFLGMQLQVELLHSFREFRPKLIGIRFAVSGRAMARTGLRMMPTFPSPSLRFRTVGFPQYGSKAGISDGAFPIGAGYCVARFASVLRALRLHRRDPRTVPRLVARLSTSVRADYSALPQGPSLRSGFYCPSPSSLTRPHPSHSRAHPDFTALRLIRDALAVRCRLGDPRVVPGFHGTFLLDMLSSKTAGSPSAAFAQFFADVAGLRPDSKGSALPSDPIIRFRWAVVFAATLVRYPLRPVELLASLADLAELSTQPPETFTPELSTGRSPFPLSGITTVATEQAPPVGLTPTGTTVKPRCTKSNTRWKGMRFSMSSIFQRFHTVLPPITKTGDAHWEVIVPVR